MRINDYVRVKKDSLDVYDNKIFGGIVLNMHDGLITIVDHNGRMQFMLEEDLEVDNDNKYCKYN